MERISFTRFEDNIIKNNIDNNGKVNVYSAQEELNSNGYIRTINSIRRRVYRLRMMGRITN